MLSDQPLLPDILQLRLVVRAASSCHNVVFFVCIKYLLKYPWHVINKILVGWRTSNIPHGQMRLTSLNSLITAMYLGPGFLKNNGPELTLVSLRESYFVALHRDVVV